MLLRCGVTHTKSRVLLTPRRRHWRRVQTTQRIWRSLVLPPTVSDCVNTRFLARQYNERGTRNRPPIICRAHFSEYFRNLESGFRIFPRLWVREDLGDRFLVSSFSLFSRGIFLSEKETKDKKVSVGEKAVKPSARRKRQTHVHKRRRRSDSQNARKKT